MLANRSFVPNAGASDKNKAFYITQFVSRSPNLEGVK